MPYILSLWPHQHEYKHVIIHTILQHLALILFTTSSHRTHGKLVYQGKKQNILSDKIYNLAAALYSHDIYYEHNQPISISAKKKWQYQLVHPGLQVSQLDRFCDLEVGQVSQLGYSYVGFVVNLNLVI